MPKDAPLAPCAAGVPQGEGEGEGTGRGSRGLGRRMRLIVQGQGQGDKDLTDHGVFDVLWQLGEAPPNRAHGTRHALSVRAFERGGGGLQCRGEREFRGSASGHGIQRSGGRSGGVTVFGDQALCLGEHGALATRGRQCTGCGT